MKYNHQTEFLVRLAKKECFDLLFQRVLVQFSRAWIKYSLPPEICIILARKKRFCFFLFIWYLVKMEWRWVFYNKILIFFSDNIYMPIKAEWTMHQLFSFTWSKLGCPMWTGMALFLNKIDVFAIPLKLHE